MRTVWKHALDVRDDAAEFLWAPGTAIVHVGPHPDSNSTIQFWAEHDPALSGTGRRVRLRVFGTGHDIPNDWTHIGTSISGPFVWHLYVLYA